MRIFYSVASLLLVTAALAPSYAQGQTDDASAIEQAAGTHLRSQLGTAVALDIRTQTPDGLQVIHTLARLHSLATALGATEVRGDTIFVCGRFPSDCQIRNFKTLVRFDDPRISGSTATILVTVRSRTERRRFPVQRKEFEVSLTRTGATWRVIDVKTVSMT